MLNSILNNTLLNNTNINDDYDVKKNYIKLGKRFSDNYYNLCDNDFSKLEHYYKKNSVFTFCEEEFMSFKDYSNKIKLFLGIFKFDHIIKKIDSQPIGEYGLLVNVYGTVKINNNLLEQKFTETFILEKNTNNVFFIINTIFRVIE